MTLYDILEVSPRASKEVIEKAYKALVKKYHPDLHNPNKKAWAEDMMKKLNHAYETIMDEKKRTEYNKEIGIDLSELLEDKPKKLGKVSDDVVVNAFINWFRGQE